MAMASTHGRSVILHIRQERRCSFWAAIGPSVGDELAYSGDGSGSVALPRALIACFSAWRSPLYCARTSLSISERTRCSSCKTAASRNIITPTVVACGVHNLTVEGSQVFIGYPDISEATPVNLISCSTAKWNWIARPVQPSGRALRAVLTQVVQ
jgi:hypothetical protein